MTKFAVGASEFPYPGAFSACKAPHHLALTPDTLLNINSHTEVSYVLTALSQALMERTQSFDAGSFVVAGAITPATLRYGSLKYQRPSPATEGWKTSRNGLSAKLYLEMLLFRSILLS